MGTDRTVNFRLPVDLYDRIQELADRETRTVTQQVRHMLAQWWKHETERGDQERRLSELEDLVHQCVEHIEDSQRETASESKAV